MRRWMRPFRPQNLSRKPKPKSIRLLLERLEDRLTPSTTYTVNDSSDAQLDAPFGFPLNGPAKTASGTITLVSAIQQIQLDGEAGDTIAFSVTTAGQGTATIGTNEPVNINATGVSINFAGHALNLGAGSNFVGGTFIGELSLGDIADTAASSMSNAKVNGQLIVSCGSQIDQSKIYGSATVNGQVEGGVQAGSNVTLSDDLIGTTSDGMSLASDDAGDVEIGGGCTVTGCTISFGFNAGGLDIYGGGGSITDNFIGTSSDGNQPLGDAFGIQGALFGQGNNYTITGNVIADIGAQAILVGNNCTITENMIGTDVTGEVAMANGYSFASQGAPGGLPSVTVGDNCPMIADNVISNNAGPGLSIGKGNTVMGNRIGVDLSGARAMGNRGAGVIVVGTNNVLGGILKANLNVISGTTLSPGGGSMATGNGAGILLGSGNHLLNNFIGTDVTGSVPLPNAGAGVFVNGNDNQIGVAGPGSNIISGNGGDGVDIMGGSGNTLVNNLIGTGFAGQTKLGNGGNGVEINGGSNNHIGVESTPNPNYIDSNLLNGVLITGLVAATGNLVQHNDIGGGLTTAHGNLGNKADGVAILDDASMNTIGGTSDGDANIVVANGGDGVDISQASQNLVEGNFIGYDPSGSTPDPANQQNGVLINDGQSNTVGGTTPAAGNVIGNNALNGVLIKDMDSSENVVEGNFIGTDTTKQMMLANIGVGVFIQDGSKNTIGGSDPSDANVITGNYSGVAVAGQAKQDLISQNLIYQNQHLGIDLGATGTILPEQGQGVQTGPNDSTPYPILNSITTGLLGTTVSGFLPASANQEYTIQFYSNQSLDPAGLSEGQFYLGSIPAPGDGSQFQTTFDVPPGGDTYITAIAIASNGDTSEFSPARDILRGAVVVEKSSADIDAYFRPYIGATPISLALAAQICGVDHFNWLQQITALPSDNQRFIYAGNWGLLKRTNGTFFYPPPPGGEPTSFLTPGQNGQIVDQVVEPQGDPLAGLAYGTHSAIAAALDPTLFPTGDVPTPTVNPDTYPYYWNESQNKNDTAALVNYLEDPDASGNPTMLQFYDHPSSLAAFNPGGKGFKSFHTQLAGVMANEASVSWIGLKEPTSGRNTSFSWSSNAITGGPGQVTSSYDVVPLGAVLAPLISGGVSGVQYDGGATVVPSTISTIAGGALAGYTGDGGAATAAILNGPTGVAVDANGNVFVVDSANNVVREINAATGVITTIAGNGTKGYSGDGGAATAAELNDPTGLAVDAAGDLFIMDSGNNVVREVKAGVISTVAGNGTAGYQGDGGAATAAKLNGPMAVAVNSSGDLFIVDSGNNVVREVKAGVISTVAGNGTKGYSGDGGAATAAALNDPVSVAVDAAGDLFIADLGNAVVREVHAATGTITTIAGNGTAGFRGDGGAATAAELNGPDGVIVDGVGDVFIADAKNHDIREINGATGIINSIAGVGAAGYSGDGGAPTAAALAAPSGLARDGNGNLYFADASSFASVVRKIVSPGPALYFSATSLTNAVVGASYSQTLTATNGQGPFTFVYSGGVLPSGMSLSDAGRLSGTPTEAGTFTFTVTALDSSAPPVIGSQTYTLTVNGSSLVFSPTSLPAGKLGAAYSQALAVSGGTAPYAFSVAPGTLPPGLTLSSAGLLSGTPTANGSYSFFVQATDANSLVGGFSYILTVSVLTLSPTSLPAARIGAAYSQAFAAAGGTAPFSFKVTSGALPAGLSLSAAGLLSGTPTAGGSFSYTVQATDSSATPLIASFTYTLTVSVPGPTAVLKADGSLWQYDATGGLDLLSPAGTIVSISTVVDGSGAADVFAITTTGDSLYEHTPAGWSEVSGGYFGQISAATDKTGAAVVFGILGALSPLPNSLYEHTTAGWAQLSPAGTILSVSAVGTAQGEVAFAIVASGSLWEYSAGTPAKPWSLLSAGAFGQVSAGLNASGQAVAYGVLLDASLWEYNPAFAGLWQNLSPAGTILSAVAGGPDEVFAITAGHTLWEHNLAVWSDLSDGSFASVAAAHASTGADEVFAVLSDASVWWYDSTFPRKWENLLPSGAAAVS